VTGADEEEESGRRRPGRAMRRGLLLRQTVAE
jgi:hypothetical protein